jgi:YD repeat-containing protein
MLDAQCSVLDSDRTVRPEHRAPSIAPYYLTLEGDSMKDLFSLFRRPPRGSACRGWGALGLLLLGLGKPAAAACPEMYITQPANGATGVSGIVRVDIAINGNPYGGQYSPYCAIINDQDEYVEVGTTTDEGLIGSARHYTYEWDTRLVPKATYTIRAIDFVGPSWHQAECASDAVTVTIASFRYTRHVLQAKIPPHVVSDYVATRGGSTHPLLGFQAFAVPVTSWQHHGKTYSMALHHDSSSMVDPQNLPPVDFPGLSEKASRWSHDFAMWLDAYEDEHGVEHLIWHRGDGRVLDFVKPWTTFVSPDSYHTLTFGGGPITSPSFPWAGGTDTLQCPYGWFVIKDAEGTRFEFNVSPPAGQTHLLWKTGDGVALPHWLLTRVVDRWNRTLNLTWSGGAEPRVTAAKDGNNVGVTLGYTGSLLTSITDPQGRTHSLSYSAVPDENGTNRQKLTSVTVLGPGSPNRVTHTWSFSYRDPADPNLAYGGTCTGDLVIQRTDPTGLVTSYRYQSVNSPSRPTEQDWMGRITSVRWLDSSEGTTVEKVITRTASGQTGTLTYPGSVVRQYTYSTDYTLTSVYHPGADRLWQYSSDPQRNIRTVRGPAERYTISPLAEITYVKDADGHIIQQTVKTRQADDTLGDPVEMQYNALNLPTQVRKYARAGSGNADQITRYEYDDGGTLTAGNLTQVIEAYGASEQRVTQHFYEGADGAWGLRTRTRNATGGDSTADYDNATGWLLSTASPQNLVVGATHPDRPSSVTATTYTSDGFPCQTTDPEGHVVLISYNATAPGSPNLVTTATFADGSYTQVTTDPFGRVLESRDEKGVRTVTTYNPEGKAKTITRAAGTADQRVTTNYYDLRGDLVAIDPPGGSSGRIQFEYNRYDQYGNLAMTGDGPIYEGAVTRILYADGTDEGCGINAGGDLAWERKADGSVIYRFYDAAHRHISTSYPAHTSEAAFSVSDTLDEFGRVVSRTDRTGTTTATFDGLDRPVLVTPPSPQKALSFSYLPDTVLQRWITTVSVAGVGSYEYREDSKGRTCEVINPFSQSFWSEFSPDGKNVLEVHPNGVREERSYTGRDWLAGVLFRKADGNVLDTLGYFYTDSLGNYEPTGRLQREVDGLAQTHAFSYDLLGELVGESHPDIGSVSYTIDANGNRSSKTTAAGTDYYGVTAANKLLWVNRGTNAVPTSGQSAPYTLFTYDANGCMTRRERRYDGGLLKTLDLTWDGDNRLRQIKEGATTRFSADYRGDGLRVGKWDSWTAQHNYTWGPGGIVFDSSGSTVLTPGLAQRSNGVDQFFQLQCGKVSVGHGGSKLLTVRKTARGMKGWEGK